MCLGYLLIETLRAFVLAMIHSLAQCRLVGEQWVVPVEEVAVLVLMVVAEVELAVVSLMYTNCGGRGDRPAE